MKLRFGGSKTYPNGAVPLAATLDLLRARGMAVTCDQVPNEIAKTHLLEPLPVSEFSRRFTPATNTVWKYSSEAEARRLANLFVEVLQNQVVCEEGVLDTLQWCLYEALDNVFQHSEAASGYAMMQLHWQRRLCAISVADTGIGIQRSLWTGIGAGTAKYALADVREPHQAVQFALRQGATRRPNYNQGNGLFGLRRAAELNQGKLAVRSGWGYWALVEGEVTEQTDRQRPLIDMERHQGTWVDWEVDCSTPVLLRDVLPSKTTRSDVLESIEVATGFHRVMLNEINKAVGSRNAGTAVRNRLLNYLKAGAPSLVVDFTGFRGVVSSSFADEVFGKLALELGELPFRRRVFLESISETNRALIERAVQMRLDEPVAT
ncbi:hypothetical protein L332_09450 [Agrococcus pavilionensis RW1]|uniref:DUF4325 domain-containing protein n=1 Tax=Agrococcus pavilionensis RW1 TaxID=1330458 RepID=U1MRU3_9MICO|nr:DUF4325 domain-containing protein [Agrococcus pavilionensis]ERG64671.1 hypothetical protein L332_09450 [Agrococcus pavilionensis RW1]